MDSVGNVGERVTVVGIEAVHWDFVGEAKAAEIADYAEKGLD